MSLEHLWAGWRSRLRDRCGGRRRRTTAADAPDRRPGRCVFCRIAASGPPSADNGVLWVGRTAFAVLNAYPYASGHLMVAARSATCAPWPT